MTVKNSTAAQSNPPPSTTTSAANTFQFAAQKPAPSEYTVNLQKKFGGPIMTCEARIKATKDFNAPMKLGDQTLYFKKTDAQNFQAQTKLYGKRAGTTLTPKPTSPQASNTFTQGTPQSRFNQATSGIKITPNYNASQVGNEYGLNLTPSSLKTKGGTEYKVNLSTTLKNAFPLTKAPPAHFNRGHTSHAPTLQYQTGKKPEEIRQQRQAQGTAQRGGFHAPTASIDRKGEVKIA